MKRIRLLVTVAAVMAVTMAIGSDPASADHCIEDSSGFDPCNPDTYCLPGSPIPCGTDPCNTPGSHCNDGDLIANNPGGFGDDFVRGGSNPFAPDKIESIGKGTPQIPDPTTLAKNAQNQTNAAKGAPPLLDALGCSLGSTSLGSCGVSIWNALQQQPKPPDKKQR